MPQTLAEAGLTTGHAPFVEQARTRGELYITQPYELYSQENHDTWRALYSRIRPRWERYANDHFLLGIEALALPADRVPRLADINRRLKPLTGFQAKPVSGYVPGFLFFDCLRRREFPTTITIRPADRMDYLPEPDIFHDTAGHVPMHTEKAFADVLVRFGDCAVTAAEMTADVADYGERVRRLTHLMRAMSRFFWFTVEFGLMRGRGPNGICAYGSGGVGPSEF
jgi:phenylalanine-4-hydroxylase